MSEEVVIGAMRGLTLGGALVCGGIVLATAWSAYQDWRERKRIERIVSSMDCAKEGDSDE